MALTDKQVLDNLIDIHGSYKDIINRIETGMSQIQEYNLLSRMNHYEEVIDTLVKEFKNRL